MGLITMARHAAFRVAMVAAGVLVAGTQVAAPAHVAPARAATGSTVQELGHLGGGQSWANDINNAGQVVGTSTTASGERHAFLWDPKTRRMTDLGTP